MGGMTDKHPLNEALSKALNIRLTGWDPAHVTDDAIMAAREAGLMITLSEMAYEKAPLWRATTHKMDNGDFHTAATADTPAEAIGQAVLAAIGGSADALERAAGVTP